MAQDVENGPYHKIERGDPLGRKYGGNTLSSLLWTGYVLMLAVSSWTRLVSSCAM